MRDEQQVNGDLCAPDTATSSSIRLEGPVLWLDTQATSSGLTDQGVRPGLMVVRRLANPCTQIKEI